jgi:hypothetical protein
MGAFEGRDEAFAPLFDFSKEKGRKKGGKTLNLNIKVIIIALPSKMPI